MSKQKTEAADYKRLTLRLPEDVLVMLQQQARSIGRNVNTHTLFVLRYGLGIDSAPPLPGGMHVSCRRRDS